MKRFFGKMAERGEVRRAFSWLLATTVLGCGQAAEEQPVEVDETAPAIVSVSPAHTSVGVEPEAVIEVTFAEPVTAAEIAVTVGGEPVEGVIEVNGTTARFTPASRYALESSQTVAITATDAAGNVSTGESSFTVRGGEWRAAAAVDVRSAQVADARAVALPNGAVSVWTESTDTSMSVRTSTFVPGEGWTPSSPLWVAGYAVSPVVATSPAGDAIAAWQGIDDEGEGLYAARYSATGWSAVEKISGTAWQPVATFDGETPVVAWYQSSADGSDVMVRRFAEGAWTVPAVVDADGAQGSEPALAAFDGGVMIAWTQSGGVYGPGVYASTIVAGQVSPSQLLTGTVQWAWGVRVAVSEGTAFLAWVEIAEDGATRIASRSLSLSSGTWSDSAFFGADSGVPDAPRIAAGEGIAALAWQEWDAFADVRAAVLVDGTWSAEVVLDAAETSSAGTPGVSIDANGGVFVSWDEGESTRTVSARRYSEGEWSSIVALGEGYEPALVAGKDGSAVSLWRDESGVRYATFD